MINPPSQYYNIEQFHNIVFARIRASGIKIWDIRKLYSSTSSITLLSSFTKIFILIRTRQVFIHTNQLPALRAPKMQYLTEPVRINRAVQEDNRARIGLKSQSKMFLPILRSFFKRINEILIR